jgi:hypothetical protein
MLSTIVHNASHAVLSRGSRVPCVACCGRRPGSVGVVEHGSFEDARNVIRLAVALLRRVSPDFAASRSYPLVLNIHGGPTSASKTNFNPLAQLMAAEGWLVYMPNSRGSDNLGNAYLAAILGDYGKGPGRDVMPNSRASCRRDL